MGAPSSWQIGPLADLVANWLRNFLGPSLPLFGTLGPGKLGPSIRNIFVLDVLPMIEEYLSVELIYCYWTYFANNWEDICLLEVSVCHLGAGNMLIVIGTFQLTYTYIRQLLAEYMQ